jgi:hypothetical protein
LSVVGATLIAVPTLPVVPVAETKFKIGIPALTAIVTVVVAVPALLVTLTVYSVADDVTAGVPEITQVIGLIESPDKSAGDIAQSVIVAP